MRRLTRDRIKYELEQPNGSAALAGDPGIDKIALCDETLAMFLEEGIGSSLLARLAKSRTYMLRMSMNSELIPTVRNALASENPKLRRNSARLLGLISKDEADTQLLARSLFTEDTRFVRPSLLLALGAIGGPGAQAVLDAYEPAPPADETEQKHYDDECEALKLARVTAMKHEKHTFIGLDKEYEIELMAPDQLSERLKAELEELGFSAYDIKRDSLKVKTNDYLGLFDARCFREALFPIVFGTSLRPDRLAAKVRPFMERFMKATHEGTPPYRYRIEIEGESTDTTALKKEIRDAIDAGYQKKPEIVNAPSNYEMELRIVSAGNASRVYLKLYTVKDERFAYRLETIPASMNPSTAAAVLQLASEYLTVNARVIDPCCGSGTLLFERGLLSPCETLTGVDIAHRAIDAARRNAEAAVRMGVKLAKFVCNDIIRFECRRPYDELICNLPFGHRVGTHSSCALLYDALLKKIPELVRRGGIAVLYTMEFTLLKNLIKENPQLEILKQERTESGGLMPMIFILRVK